jgi:hypothetical protein
MAFKFSEPNRPRAGPMIIDGEKPPELFAGRKAQTKDGTK